jgi:hypothetical protein
MFESLLCTQRILKYQKVFNTDAALPLNFGCAILHMNNFVNYK